MKLEKFETVMLILVNVLVVSAFCWISIWALAGVQASERFP